MATPHITIRPAVASDAVGHLAIYGPIVENTSISFELTPPTEDEIAARIISSNKKHRWLTADAEGIIAGYAYGNTHRARAAYDYSVEVSVFVHTDFRGQGLGRKLYRQLFDELSALGYYNAFAGVTLPNDASIALHESVGFQHIGTFPNIGFKFGTWCDTGWFHKQLKDGVPPAHCAAQ
jgi:phosphinothricin acetyltransferase